MSDDIDTSEAELLAPWYASGSLSDAETAIVEAEIARNPEFAKTLQLVDDERHVVREFGDDLDRPSSASFTQFVDILNAEPDRQISLLQRVKSAFASYSRPMKFALLSLTTLAVLQSGFIVSLVQNSEQQYQTAAGDSITVSAEFTLLVAFVGTASFDEVTALMQEANAEIIAGPKTGLYTLGFLTLEAANAGLETLEARPEIIRFAARGS